MGTFDDLFKKDNLNFDNLKDGECIELSATGMDEDGGTEKLDIMLACRTDKDTVKIKSDMGEEFQMEMMMKKRPMKKGDFKK